MGGRRALGFIMVGAMNELSRTKAIRTPMLFSPQRYPPPRDYPHIKALLNPMLYPPQCYPHPTALGSPHPILSPPQGSPPKAITTLCYRTKRYPHSPRCAVGEAIHTVDRAARKKFDGWHPIHAARKRCMHSLLGYDRPRCIYHLPPSFLRVFCLKTNR